MSNLPDFSPYNYQVESELGHNRVGGRVTYKATSTPPIRPNQGGDKKGVQVVIKQFQFAQFGASWTEYDAYEREIEVLRNLNHPGIPHYLDSFETPAGFCLVQEYKDAPSLATSRRFTPQDIKQIALSILKILIYLQSQTPAVIHRDIKPENILVGSILPAKVYLVDFGFARVGGGEVAVSSVVKGTLEFMPPEQLFNRQLTNDAVIMIAQSKNPKNKSYVGVVSTIPGDVSTTEVLSIGFVCESEKPTTTISTVPTFQKDERGNQYLGCPEGYKDLGG